MVNRRSGNRSSFISYFMIFFVCCLITDLSGTSRAYATTPTEQQSAAERMKSLKIVVGMTPNGDLALNAELTRAQLVTILVRAFGQDQNAKYLNGAAAFRDTANHPWASGYIAMAKALIERNSNGKETIGLPDGTFHPDGMVTTAEALALIMKFIGVPKDARLSWPDDYIQGAVDAGLITAEDKDQLAHLKNAPATRGLAFYLADRTFYNYKLPEGKSVYTMFTDSVNPELRVDSLPATTLEESITITGIADGAAAVSVGTENADMSAGKFAATVALKMGENVLHVKAVDLAGNIAEQSATITRLPRPASIEVTPSDVVMQVGGSLKFTIVVKDTEGKPIENAAVTWQADGGEIDSSAVYHATTVGDFAIAFKSGEVVKPVKVSVRPRPAPQPSVPTTIETSETPVNIAAGHSAEWKFTVYDQFGRPFQNATVCFGVTGSLTFGGLSAESALTDAEGEVIVSYLDGVAGHSGTITANIENTAILTSTGTIKVIASALALSDASPAIVTVGQSVYATSNQNGYVYLVTDIAESPTFDDLERAARTGVKVEATANIPVSLDTTGLLPGDFFVFAVNSEGEVSTGVPVRIDALPDTIPPVLSEGLPESVVAGDALYVTSNEDGYIYLVYPEVGGSPKVEDLDFWVNKAYPVDGLKYGVKVPAQANIPTMIDTSALARIRMLFFAVDTAGNVSVSPPSILIVEPPTVDDA